MGIDRSGWPDSAEPAAAGPDGGARPWPSRLSRPGPADLALLAVLALAIAPIWAARRLPTQDGPSHVYNARLLARLARAPGLAGPIFAVRLEPFPNWAGHAGLAALMALGLSPMAAEKALVTLYLAGVALGTRYLLRSVGPGREAWAPSSMAMAYNFPFFMGYYNFLVGVPPTLFLLGYAWRHRGALRSGPALVLAGGLVGIYFAHLVAFGVAALGVAILTIGGARPGRRFEALGKLNLVFLPSMALLGWYVTASDRGFVGDAPPWSVVLGSADGPGKLLGRLAGSVLGPTPRHSVAASGLALAAVMAVGAAAALSAARAGGPAGPAEAPARGWPFPVLVAELASLALIFPQNWGHHGGAFTERVAVFVGLLGLACLPAPRPGRALALALASSVALAMVGLGGAWAQVRDGDRELAGYLDGLPEVPGGSRVLPLLFHHQPEDRVLLLEHLADYLCLGEGVVNWDNYEARGFCFPVRFREGVDPPDPGAYRRGDDSGVDRDLARADVVLAGPRCPPAIRARLESGFPAARRAGRITVYSRAPPGPPR